jgi:hypothetical protein
MRVFATSSWRESRPPAVSWCSTASSLIRRRILREVLESVTEEIIADMQAGLMADHPG